MGNFKNLVNKDRQQDNAITYVLSDESWSIDVFRRKRKAGAGFSSEVGEQEIFRTINVRVDENGPELKGLTSDVEVRVDDLWRYTNLRDQVRYFRVDRVVRLGNASDVYLEEIKK